MSSFTITDSATFTITHARHMGAKVAADLKRIQRLYGGISDERIAEYEVELIEYIKAGYVDTVTYGFQINDQWIEPTLRYTARELNGYDVSDDDPGKVRPGADVTGARFSSYLTYSSKWSSASQSEKDSFKGRLPFSRSAASEPTIKGYLLNDKTYSAGGRSLARSSVRSF
ncbi:MAG: hypothetical protein LWW83_12620 [Azonexaceae bacterium]|uniref:HORMA-1 domain-containing protein n=1 Tax=Azonexus fungiphilus TaxID=146940 RepID=UPI00156B5BEC|nr:hypothetical protein [Azonexus fungiphilus]MCE1240754.1 hypothetical protein [Azonexaceae bacterium]NHC08580.1 hypothetical protein [Azonexus fungiphilus]